MGEIRYNGGFIFRDGSGSVGGGRIDDAYFFYVFPFLLPMSGKSLIL